MKEDTKYFPLKQVEENNNNHNQKHNSHDGEDRDTVTQFMKISSAIFYGISSFLITVVNKQVLTTYKFPSFLVLSLGQLLASIVVLYAGKRCNIVTIPNYSNDLVRKIFPLPLIYLGNMIFGLGGTQALSLPMFTALRRFSILMTMVLEFYILGSRPTKAVQISVYAMVGGALVAASDDLSFSVYGYMYVMLTNSLTALNGVFVKQKLNASDLGSYGLMYYNSLIMFLPTFVCAWALGDIQDATDFKQWGDPMFTVQFLLSCVMGFILTYSTILCTQYNSALTTTIVGCLKNISITYLGMFIGGDYVFSWLNCIGINISVLGSLLYSYITFKKKPKSQQPSKSSQDDIEKLLKVPSNKIDTV